MPTILDRAIGYLSPRAAFERAQYREALALSARAYDAAKSGRRGEGWIATGTSANAEIEVAANTIRARARDLARNNSYAVAVVSKIAAAAWGTGIVPRLNAKDRKDPRRIAAKRIWDDFTRHSDPEGQLDFYGQINVGVRAMIESGEFLVRRIWRDESWPVPFQIQVLEGDYLDTSKNQSTDKGGVIIQGVEFDSAGRRVAYWLFDQHPGGTVFPTMSFAYVSKRVPAVDVRHVYEPQRPGQTRGVSVFAPAVLKLRDLDDFEDARLMQAKVASCLCAFVSGPGGPLQSPIAGAGGTSTKSDGARVEMMKPGTINYLPLGREITFPNMPSAPGYEDFVRQHLRAVSAGVGVTYEMLSNDLSGTNFSSIRIGRNDFLDRIEQLQWLTLIPQVCIPIWDWVIAASDFQGEDAGVDRSATWTTPARRMMSPKEDIDAGVAEVRAGRKSLFDLIAETGEHPEEKLEEIARVNALLDELGIVSDADGRKVGKTSTPSVPEKEKQE